MRRLARAQAPFVTRGDRSGTHVKELELWSLVGLEPAAPWYQVSEVGAQGNAPTALDAARRGAYTLLDRSTLIVAQPDLAVLVQGDPRLLNVFTVIPVNPERAPDVDGEGGESFARWLLQPGAQSLIHDFGRAEYGAPLFLARHQLPADFD